MEKADSVRQGIFDKHSLRIAGDEPLSTFRSVIGQKDCGLLMSKVLDKELAKRAFGNGDALLEHSWSSEFSGDMLKGHDTPGRGRKRFNFGKQTFMATTQCDKGHADGVEGVEVSLKNKTVIIDYYEDKTNLEKIKKTIEDSGYTIG